MLLKLGTHQLRYPATPKLQDSDSEAVRREHEDKLRELQDLARSLRAGPTVTGSKGGNAALTSLIAALVSLGLITDETT